MYSVILGTSHVSEASCQPLLTAAILGMSSAFEGQPQGTLPKSRRRLFACKPTPHSLLYKSPNARSLFYVCPVVDEAIQTPWVLWIVEAN